MSCFTFSFHCVCGTCLFTGIAVILFFGLEDAYVCEDGSSASFLDIF